MTAGEFSVGQEFTFSRLFAAPRPLVFRSWTDPKQLAQWWGPREFTNPVCEVDARTDGKLRIEMCGPDGTVYPMTGIFREIAEPELLAFTSTPLDEKGRTVFEILNTVTFSEEEGGTRVTVHARILAIGEPGTAGEYLSGMEEGWNGSLERLAELLGSA